MSFLRHVGKHGDRNLVAYTQLLNQNIHDPMMETIESDIGQNSEELADALNRTHTRSGDRILQVLHAEGMLKKVRCEDIVMTPGPNQQIRLDELNKILTEMKAGEEATRKLAEADASAGLQDPADVRRRKEGLIGDQVRPEPTMGTNADNPNLAMNDDVLARDFMAQAERMEAEAKGLIAESKRLMKEAKAMMPKPAKKTPAKKTTRKKTAAK